MPVIQIEAVERTTYRRQTKLPITMAAAMLMLIIAGGIVIFMNTSPSSSRETLTGAQAALQETQLAIQVTQTAIMEIKATAQAQLQLQPVIIARYDLSKGTKISEDMLAVVYWPDDLRPTGTVPNVEAAISQYLQNDVARWQPIFSPNLSVEPLSSASTVWLTPKPDATWTFDLQGGDDVADWIVVTIPIAQVDLSESIVNGLQEGDQVTILSEMSFIESLAEKSGDTFTVIPPEAGRSTIHTVIVQEARIVGFGDDSAEGWQNNVIMVAVRPLDAMTLRWVIEAKLPVTLVVSEGSTDQSK